MANWPKDTQAARNAFYGDPGNSEIAPQMVPVVPPFAMYYEGPARQIDHVSSQGGAGVVRGVE
ncbi:hypothetical protein IVA87_03030 [Bradyrhizobium sp. 147]|uniref:hypothetical protein n=1 Tax=unclassified Bradyrhizobium TaxID=2631580 RepID=UPI001FF943CE|nr:MULTISPECIES: hypothetical protein [unclassified Bradyrhizobium]MCK1545991.1 hypothetical protein [Bradyrhizobium sp. 179]MCK1678473.1 hypothetical protein [Bradyrhizobium sp. 147]